MDTFAKRVKARRIELELTQGELAIRSGIKQSDISKIENSKILQPAGILGLARALKCNPDWLSTGEGEMLTKNYTLSGEPGIYVRDASGLTPEAIGLARLYDMIPVKDQIRRAVAWADVTKVLVPIVEQNKQAATQEQQPSQKKQSA
jgi:transcriptional regulator with XRE-family HTH domain